jgi:hypothetical protein
LNCNLFSHFATESEVVRSGSYLPAGKRQEEAKKGGASKAKTGKLIPLQGLVTALQPNPKTEEVGELSKALAAPVVSFVAPVPAVAGVRAAPEALVPAPVQPTRTALLASLVALAQEKPPLVPPKESKLAPALPEEEETEETQEEGIESLVEEKGEAREKEEPRPLMQGLPALQARQGVRDEELLNEVSKELRLLALKRKVREVADTLTYRLRGL